MKNLFIPGFLAILLFSACIREECQVPNGVYLFEIPVTLSPAKDTFRVGDTLSIVSEFSDDVFELNTARTYKLPNFTFSPATEMRKIDEEDSPANISDNFDFWVPEGTDYNLSYLGSEGGQYAVGQYVYENGHYRLEFKLVARRPGLYAIEQGCALLKGDQDFEGKCDRLDMEVFSRMNEGADNNIQLLSDSPDPHFSEWILIKPQTRFHKFGGYCFIVL